MQAITHFCKFATILVALLLTSSASHGQSWLPPSLSVDCDGDGQCRPSDIYIVFWWLSAGGDFAAMASAAIPGDGVMNLGPFFESPGAQLSPETLPGGPALATLASSSDACWAFIRGDVNNDDAVDISDANAALAVLFNGASSDNLDRVDTDDSGSLDISDAIKILDFLFLGGDPPLSPFPTEGIDPTCDSIPIPACGAQPAALQNLTPTSTITMSGEWISLIVELVDLGCSGAPAPVSGISVQFTADSGVLGKNEAVTDIDGRVTVLFMGDHGNFTHVVQANVLGLDPLEVTVIETASLDLIRDHSTVLNLGSFESWTHDHRTTGSGELEISDASSGTVVSTLSSTEEVITSVALAIEPAIMSDPYFLAIAGSTETAGSLASSVKIFVDANGDRFHSPSEEVGVVALGSHLAVGLGGTLKELVYLDFYSRELFAIRDTDSDGVADALDLTPIASVGLSMHWGLDPITTPMPGIYKLRSKSPAINVLMVNDLDLDGIADSIVEVLTPPPPPVLWVQAHAGDASIVCASNSSSAVNLEVRDSASLLLGSVQTQSGHQVPAEIVLSRILLLSEAVQIVEIESGATLELVVAPFPSDLVIKRSDKYQVSGSEQVTLFGQFPSAVTIRFHPFGQALSGALVTPTFLTPVTVSANSIVIVIPAGMDGGGVVDIEDTSNPDSFDMITLYPSN